ncbi:MAG: helix-turn-helix domain-containing protein [Lachnospiraceae bacterium]|nr:helix-turn-helix domain-containing protein [Lachnospiraceae bacterium]
MKTYDEWIAPESEYFIYSPSRLAQNMFLYPLQCGRFTYRPGYSLKRDSFDSFLLMYIQKGEMVLEINGHSAPIPAHSFVLIDCYRSHSYSTSTGAECLWCHFDGITARSFFENIVSRLGSVFSMPDPSPVLAKLTAILNVFHTGAVVREPLLSKYLNDILTEFMLYLPARANTVNYAGVAEEIITYINEHFAEDVSVAALADKAGLSHYHFIRTFKKETGFTPHEYLLNTRLATAQYLLKNTRLPVKEICYNSGFSCESVFCSAFKRRFGITPSQYRTLL